MSDGTDAALALSKIANIMGNGDLVRDFVTEVTNQHRTLQQQSFAIMLACIEEWAGRAENQTDLRNEWTVQKCREIMDALGPYGHKVPFI